MSISAIPKAAESGLALYTAQWPDFGKLRQATITSALQQPAVQIAATAVSRQSPKKQMQPGMNMSPVPNEGFLG